MALTLHDPFPESHRDILAARGLSFVSTVRPNGLLSTHPISALWDGGRLRFSTTKARAKYCNLLNDNRVTICIPDPRNQLRYLEIRGRGKIADDADRSFINLIAREFMGVETYPYDPPGTERVTITIEIEKVVPSRVDIASPGRDPVRMS
jgi:PPOX class probable F420-dependent enzyme